MVSGNNIGSTFNVRIVHSLSSSLFLKNAGKKEKATFQFFEKKPMGDLKGEVLIEKGIPPLRIEGENFHGPWLDAKRLAPRRASTFPLGLCGIILSFKKLPVFLSPKTPPDK